MSAYVFLNSVTGKYLKSIFSLPILALFFSLLSSSGVSAQKWKFTPLKVSNGADFSGIGLNNKGHVVGFRRYNGALVPAIWRSGALEILPLPAGLRHAELTSNDKAFINDRDQVIVRLSDGNIVRWTSGVPQRFASPINSSVVKDQTLAGLNNNGVAALNVRVGFNSVPILWMPDGSTQILGTGRTGGVTGINDKNEAVGSASPDGVNFTAVLWVDGKTQILNSEPPAPGGPLGVVNGLAYPSGVNSNGMVVGIGNYCEYSIDDGRTYCRYRLPYAYYSGYPSMLSTMNQFAYATPLHVNDKNEIFGIASNEEEPVRFNGTRYGGIAYWSRLGGIPVDILRNAGISDIYSVTFHGANNTSQVLVSYANSRFTEFTGILSNSVDMVESAGDSYRSGQPENGVYSASSRLVYGVVADGRSTAVLRIPAAYVGQQFNVEISRNSCQYSGIPLTNVCGAVGMATGLASTPPSAVSILVPAVNTPSGPMALVAYRAPDDYAPHARHYDSSTNVREVKINIYGSSLLEHKINIIRPKTVFVHGLWSVPSDLDNLAKSSIGRSYPTYMANFGEDAQLLSPNAGETSIGSSLGVSYAAAIVANQIQANLKRYKDGKNPLALPIVANRVNVVGHSMGSLVARVISLKYEDLIHKIISVGGPHQGSPMAALLAETANSCGAKAYARYKGWYSFGDCPNCVSAYSPAYAVATGTMGIYMGSGAIGDLRGYADGTGRSRLITGHLSERSPLSRPIAYLSGVLPAAVYEAFDQPSFIYSPLTAEVSPNEKAPLIKRRLSLACPLLSPLEITPVWLAHQSRENFKRFMSESTDGLVPVSSQLNLLSSAMYSLKPLQGKAHSNDTGDLYKVPGVVLGSLLDEATGRVVVDLLNTPIASEVFVR